ncbi:unnamed protein product [Musa hybrid cultivar]
MELDEEGFLDELLALRRVTWDSYPVGTSELLLCDGGRLDCSQEIPSLVSPDYSELKKAMNNRMRKVDGLPSKNLMA